MENAWGYGTVVARPLCMRKVPGSIPGISMVATFDWSRVRLTLGATCGTYSSVVERSIAVHQQPSLLLLEG